MRLKALQAEGIFSFGTGENRLRLDLDRDLTVIVGPNAAGKSNVIRVLALVQAVLRFQDSNQDKRQPLWAALEDYARFSRHEGMAPNARSVIRLEIELTGPNELKLLTSFVQMMVLSASFVNQVVDSPSLPALEAWTSEQVTPEALASLTKGTLVVSHSGVLGAQWQVSYEFEHEGAALRWHLNTELPNLSNVIAPSTLDETAELPNTVMLGQRLFGPSVHDPRLVRPPSLPFSLALLLPSEGELVQLNMNPLNANVAPLPHREFVATAGLGVGPEDPLGPFRRSYTVASVFSHILDRGLWHLGVTDPALLSRADSAESVAAGTDPRGGGGLAERLHGLKNGDQREQARYRAVQAMFEELAPGRRFEVRTERRRKPEGDETAIEIEIFPVGADLPVVGRPLRLAGTGVQQALLIAETLVGDPDRLLLLDEPATNLHPSWQRIVRSHLTNREGQCLLITHSPYLVPSDAREHLASIVRLDLRDGATRTHRLSPGDLGDERWISTLIKELDWSADPRGLLFAGGVILTEGPTELAALPTWLATSKTGEGHRTPDDLHLAFYAVGGDQSFRPFLAYLDRFDVPWAVVCDGGAFRFDVHSHIFEQVLSAGIDDPTLRHYLEREDLGSKSQSDMDQAKFDAMKDFGRSHGIFTLAPGWQRRSERGGDRESFEGFVRSQSQLAAAAEAASEEAPKSKPRAGRILAEATPCPPEVEDLYGALLEWLATRGMGLDLCM
jgi:hypothetical protein